MSKFTPMDELKELRAIAQAAYMMCRAYSADVVGRTAGVEVSPLVLMRSYQQLHTLLLDREARIEERKRV